MKPRVMPQKSWNKRKAWFMENDSVRAAVLPGGGHIGSLTLKKGPDINPLWQVPWVSMEPDEWKPARDSEAYGGDYEARLLASIMGHNLCLDFFGPPSKKEEAAGMTVHGEAPVQMWDFITDLDKDRGESIRSSVKLPLARLSVRRMFSLSDGGPVLRVSTRVENLEKRERIFGWQEHATFGPPFIEQGVTIMDCGATKCRVDTGKFAAHHRLEQGADFDWPGAPAAGGGTVDLRVFPGPEKKCGDFTAQLMNPSREWAWFCLVNPRLGLLAGYLWRRSDFPWLGNWEENYDRTAKPWDSRTLTRGLEFGLSPFAHGRDPNAEMGSLFGVPTIGRLPSLGRMETEFYAFLSGVPEDCRGVSAVEFDGASIRVGLLHPETVIELKAD